MPENIHFGNAARDGEQYRGWLVGHFINGTDSDLRRTQDVEVKWFFHPAGQERERWVTEEPATTLCMLIHGRFRIQLSAGTYTLTNEGDYLMWGPGVDHLWHAEKDSTVLTIRWPSRHQGSGRCRPDQGIAARVSIPAVRQVRNSHRSSAPPNQDPGTTNEAESRTLSA